MVAVTTMNKPLVAALSIGCDSFTTALYLYDDRYAKEILSIE